VFSVRVGVPVLAGRLSERTNLCEDHPASVMKVLPRVEIKCPQDTLLSAVQQIKQQLTHSAFDSPKCKPTEAVGKCLILDSNQSLNRRGWCVEGTKPMDHYSNRPARASTWEFRA
jgi:hypothetical protein